jgi:phosphomannomutase
MAEPYPDLKDRPVKETICLFDVDNTLTPARQSVSAEMFQTLSKLRHKCAIGYVSIFQIDSLAAFQTNCLQG